MKTTFVDHAGSVEMNLTLLLLKKDNERVIESAFNRSDEYLSSVVNAFSSRIIASLKRRMTACQQLLIDHVNDIEYNDGISICWRRKDGSFGCFNIPSFKAMQSALEKLDKAEPDLAPGEIDQILKALLNDTEKISHEDANGYKWSELISVLCYKHVEY